MFTCLMKKIGKFCSFTPDEPTYIIREEDIYMPERESNVKVVFLYLHVANNSQR